LINVGQTTNATTAVADGSKTENLLIKNMSKLEKNTK
jgi:hypothetical protein